MNYLQSNDLIYGLFKGDYFNGLRGGDFILDFFVYNLLVVFPYFKGLDGL